VVHAAPTCWDDGCSRTSPKQAKQAQAEVPRLTGLNKHNDFKQIVPWKKVSV
jgi:hypothetical protein